MIATVGDRSITWPEILPELAEAAGGQVLEEHALGLAVDAECARRSVRVTDQMVRDERTLLARSLARAANVPESEAETLIAEVRRNRRLGEARFAGLMRRNAGLRALVRTQSPDSTISTDDIATAYQLKYGPRAVARLILVRSQQAATDAAQRLASGRSFADVANELSIDPSADRGGLLDPFSLADANYPVGIRRALQEITPGRPSDPISVSFANEQGFAIVQLERTEPSVFGSPTPESVSAALEQEVRAVRERAAMDKIAQQLLISSGVSVIDRSLGWAWQQRTQQTP
jgi:parvulin-like peptidyl-prolyl isomerase